MINSGIYAFLNLINEKIYLGSAKDFYKRYHVHKSMLNAGKHDNSYLQNAWNKYGQINFLFVILEYVEDIEKLQQIEQKWIDLTKCYNKELGYNSRRIANNNIGVKFSQETKDKISKTKSDTIMSNAAKANMSKSSATRDKVRWPCQDGFRCKCENCKETHRIRNREHSREWREWNRDKYNEYQRNYNASFSRPS